MRKKMLAISLIFVMALGFAFANGTNESKTPITTTDRPDWAKGVDEVTGTLTVYTTMEETQQELLLKLWKECYPKCKIEIVADSVGTLATKIRSDATSGADVVIGGMFAADGEKYHDILQPYTSTLDKEQGFHDPSEYYTFYDVQVMCLVVNPNVLKQLGVSVKGYKDLLQPALKGKIILADPSASSSGWRQLQTILAVMGDKFDDEKGWTYVKQLMENSFSTNSSKDVYNLVNEGEYAVGLSYESTPAGIIAGGGATMQIIYMNEGNTAMPGGAAIVKDAPNLVAAKAMIDLLASTDFQNMRTDLAGRGSNKLCKPSSLPNSDTLGLVDLDYEYLMKNKTKMTDHWNQLWAEVNR
ncbi:ABC-type Fe3+ transport system, periplasmic component [Sphaerochaeta pleomorpha str. Grapes]|uniref:ABC-type Fe3+ transport system, periplasmic component n=1 Tax=Sphaerochaeta pleomorpha (strain ATCC BAA-1885 / DSM 22778 / Grapes) TaxID=158190 RepID=G8QVB9_SPHPG|nr:extracellular solute-binding protein [Sphaerochaeta pleomorpha]AEV30434.1 ABC-type Fe3+ transport system, periplasmic component [Sphaerochaeta pleomorpha str. Grapes]